MNTLPPSTIYCSFDQEDEHDDYQSEVTWREDEYASQPDVFGIELPDQDPYKQQLIDLKYQIAKQRLMLDMLSSKLTQCQVENECLRAKNTQLSDDLASAATGEQPTPSKSGRFSIVNSSRILPRENEALQVWRKKNSLDRSMDTQETDVLTDGSSSVEDDLISWETFDLKSRQQSSLPSEGNIAAKAAQLKSLVENISRTGL